MANGRNGTHSGTQADLRQMLEQQAQAKAQGGVPAQAPQGAGVPRTFRDLLERMKPEIARALPRHLDPDRIIRVTLTTVRTNPQLMECDAQSLLAAVMLSAQLGLEPGPLGHAWIVPYNNHGRKQAQFIIGYKGYLDLMWRSGMLRSIAVHEVCQNDHFELEYGLNERLVHRPALQNRGDPIGYYLCAHYKDGGHFIYFMSREDVEKIRLRSPAGKNNEGPWATDYDAMARKTVVRQAARWMPLSIEVQRALMHDETVPTRISEDMLDAPGPVPTVDVTGTVLDSGDSGSPEEAQEEAGEGQAEQQQ